ncbi:hypothetical protein [Sediminitomix flava]|uniref:DUF4249 family protein n=1 Tax=Sediminitomix flava TaxID=379075 RepID=A0A315YWE9_SEDFL|nr:hypothetical protein [Sediminitomix flava]PWJ34179.1 hypothetical protein BC781_11189 [Sediminitomix flava]
MIRKLILLTILPIVFFSCSDEYTGPTKEVKIVVKGTNFDPDTLITSGDLLLQGRLRFSVLTIKDEPLSALENIYPNMAYDIYVPSWHPYGSRQGIFVKPHEYIIGENTDSIIVQFEKREISPTLEEDQSL